jgi:hypothetical protein
MRAVELRDIDPGRRCSSGRWCLQQHIEPGPDGRAAGVDLQRRESPAGIFHRAHNLRVAARPMEREVSAEKSKLSPCAKL